MALEVVDYNNQNIKILNELGEPSPTAIYIEGSETKFDINFRNFIGISYSDPIINDKKRENSRILGFSICTPGDDNQVILEFGFVTYSSDPEVCAKFVVRYKHKGGDHTTDVNNFNTNWRTLNIQIE